ncbi:hypothetical protein PF003_g16198 [Phytophthora fragariae]|nr:hypothetical protein PF003_g16198 [Phytophthora fragariae]
MALFTLRDEYSRVGIVDASYHDFAAMAQKRSVARGLGAADPKYERVLGIFNVGSHWVAFMIDKNAKLCHMFDPLQSERNYAAIESSVRKVMEHVLAWKASSTTRRSIGASSKTGVPAAFGASRCWK